TFADESSSGWQELNFNSPVPISANTTYVASYFAPVGHYAAQSDCFAQSGVDNAPLHLLQDGVDGPNGVYAYGSQSAFPTATYQSTHYWVDVVYEPDSPTLAVSPGTLMFAALVGSANPSVQQITISNSGSGTLNWAASANVSWLILSATSGTATQSISVSVNAVGLAPGTYTG